MNEKLLSTDTTITERRSSSFGFVVPWVGVMIGFVLITQVIRILVERYDQKIFYNDKFAFSLSVPTPFIYILYFTVFGFIFFYLTKYWKTLTQLSRIGFILILAGGLANLLERIYFGYVTDYVYVFNGVLNIADFYIFLGAILIIVSRNNSEKI